MDIQETALRKAGAIDPKWRMIGLAIVGAEYILGWLPKGTHEWDKFVTPDELSDAIRAAGLSVTPIGAAAMRARSDRPRRPWSRTPTTR